MEEEDDSVFSVFRKPKAAPPPPPPHAAPAPSPAPAAAAPVAPPVSAKPDPATTERLARLEARLAASTCGEHSSRMVELEKKLAETQERAISLSVTMREREEAQKAAQREMEDMLRRLSADRRVEQLESKLMDLASRPPKEDPRLAVFEKRLAELSDHDLPDRLVGLEKRLQEETEKAAALAAALQETRQREAQREAQNAGRELALNRRLDQFEDLLSALKSSHDDASRLAQFASGLSALARKLYAERRAPERGNETQGD